MPDMGIKGNSAMALLYANTKRIETDLCDERIERKTLMKDNDSLKSKYFEEKEKNSVLERG